MDSAPTPPWTTLIDAASLRRLGPPADWVLLDCSFDLADPAAGRQQFEQAHLPGAIYLHLEAALSGSKTDAQGRFLGRHPLPDRCGFAALLGQLGIGPTTQVLAYDRQGSMFAARAWWLLHWLGHPAVVVLDGGLPAWLAEGGRSNSGPSPELQADSRPYPAVAPLVDSVDAPWLQQQLGRVRLLDARAPERFRGDVEPLDKAAGHIPGALNRFFKDNLDTQGRFRSAAALRQDFDQLLSGQAAEASVHQCGSGVTACHNLLAMAVAGLPPGRLYPGSWSEWSHTTTRPVARG